MTTTTRAAAPDATTPTLRDGLRRNRGIVVVGVLVLLVALVMALAQSRRAAGALDPDGVDRSGSHALAALLADQGVTVVRVTDTRAAADAMRREGGLATLLVVPTAPLSPRMLTEIADTGRAHTVLVQPDGDVLAALAPWAHLDSYSTATDEVPAACSWSVAGKVGPLPGDGATYTSSLNDVPRCWNGLALDDSAVASTHGTTVLGSSAALTNDRLADSGYAALTLTTLGRSRTLVWWLPSSTDPLQFSGEGQPTISDLVPGWVSWALLQLGLALVVVVWWRGRRLGRVVVEPLPVVVRATETVEGRARLYRRGHARGRASDALREGTVTRLRSRLGLPRSTDVPTLAAAVAARTGRPTAEVADLLATSPRPHDDASLTALANALDTLENEVRRS